MTIDALPPEVVLKILENLQHDRPSLIKLRQVNKFLSAAAFDVIWQMPPAEAMSEVPQGCRQNLAPKIQSLRFWSGNISSTWAYNGLRLENLHELSFWCDPDPDDIQGLFQSRLHVFKCNFDFVSASNVLPLLVQHCPNLQRLELFGVVMDLSLLAAVLRNGTKLEYVTLGAQLDTDGTVVAPLLRLAQLKLVELRIPVERECPLPWTRAMATMPGPLPQLKEVWLSGDAATLDRLLPLISGIEVLHLSLPGDWPQVYLHLATLSRLHSLKLTFTSVHHILDIEHLLLLHRLPHLHNLSISCQPGSLAVAPCSDDQQLRVFSGFPQMRRITFRVGDGEAGTGMAALVALGRASRRVEEIQLGGVYDLRQLELESASDGHGGPLFPCLQWLWLNKLLPSGAPVQEQARHLRSLVDRHAPNACINYMGDQMHSFTQKLLLHAFVYHS